MTNTVPLTQLDQDQVKAVLSEYKIHNADISFKCDASVDDLIDIIEGNRYSFFWVILGLLNVRIEFTSQPFIFLIKLTKFPSRYSI